MMSLKQYNFISGFSLFKHLGFRETKIKWVNGSRLKKNSSLLKAHLIWEFRQLLILVIRSGKPGWDDVCSQHRCCHSNLKPRSSFLQLLPMETVLPQIEQCFWYPEMAPPHRNGIGNDLSHTAHLEKELISALKTLRKWPFAFWAINL